MDFEYVKYNNQIQIQIFCRMFKPVFYYLLLLWMNLIKRTETYKDGNNFKGNLSNLFIIFLLTYFLFHFQKLTVISMSSLIL